uniref:Uncharacterized protein n=1 Tax=Triticum urartu TaxID=4572 RepID=A0A8R7TCL5_TRIUA
MRRLFHSSIHPSISYFTGKRVVEVQTWQLRERSSSASCWRSPSPTLRRRPSSSVWPSAPTAPGRTSRLRKLSKVSRWRSSVRISTATMRARRWAASTAPEPSAFPWPPTSTAPTASRSSTAPPPTHRVPARSHLRSCRCLRAPPPLVWSPAPRRTRRHCQSARRRPCAGRSRSTSSSTSTTRSPCHPSRSPSRSPTLTTAPCPSRSPSRSPTPTTTPSLPRPPMAAAVVDTMDTIDFDLPPSGLAVKFHSLLLSVSERRCYLCHGLA